jgi:hypothetical protein
MNATATPINTGEGNAFLIAWPHFEPTQLAGVMIGDRMNPQNRRRKNEIIEARRERIARGANGLVLFDLVLFDAKLSSALGASCLLPLPPEPGTR